MTGPLWIAPAASAEVPLADRLFEIWRKGEPIGTHWLSFRRTDSGLLVEQELRLAVKLAFITVYRYQQNVTDLWRNGVLTSSDSACDNNGARSTLTLRASGGRLRVDGPRGHHEHALGTMTDLSFWNPAIVRQRGLIDMSTGELSSVAAEDGQPDRVRVGGREIDAKRHRFAVTNGREGEVWYDAEGRLVRGAIRHRGELLDYRLAG